LKSSGKIKLVQNLKKNNAVNYLEYIWELFHYYHISNKIILDISEWIVLTCNDPVQLAKFAYTPDNYNPGFSCISFIVIESIEKIAAAILKIDPNNKDALYLYSQEDFMQKVNKKKNKENIISGPPVKDKGSEQWVKIIQDIILRFEKGEHPLNLYVEMEMVPVKTSEVVNALIDGLNCKEWRGQKACCEALGRTKLEFEKVVITLSGIIKSGKQELIEGAAEALTKIHSKASSALDTLIITIEEKTKIDAWDDRYIVGALLAIAPFSPREIHSKLIDCIEKIIIITKKLPIEKLSFYGYSDFIINAEKVLRKLKC
jgi:hypothetical protein